MEIITEVRKSGPPDRPWVVAWWTDFMPIAEYWYFKTEAEAKQQERAIHGDKIVRLTPDGPQAVNPEAQQEPNGTPTLLVELLALARQYRDDMLFRPSASSRIRRLEWIESVLAKADGRS